MDQPLVTIVTPTGHRPEAFKLCQKYVSWQTYPKDKIQWIVVTDDEKSAVSRDDLYQLVIGELQWKPGYNTQRFNLWTVLNIPGAIRGEYLFFFEDDDFYTPAYIEEYVYLLQKFSVVGEGNAKYYHLPTKTFQEMKNYEHASLASTGMRKEIIPLFEEALHGGDKFFDYIFWQLVKQRNVNALIFTNKQLSIGIKGMPGRKGIGIGHTPENYQADGLGTKFTEWMGEHGELYREWLGSKLKKKG